MVSKISPDSFVCFIIKQTNLSIIRAEGNKSVYLSDALLKGQQKWFINFVLSIYIYIKTDWTASEKCHKNYYSANC